MHVLDFSTELPDAEVSVALLKSYTREAPSNFEISQNKQREHLRWSQFSAQLQIGGLHISNFLKGALIKTFFFQIISQNFHNSSFSNVLSKMCDEFLDCRAVALEKKVQIRIDFFEIFEISGHPFLSERFQNIFVMYSGSRLQTIFAQLFLKETPPHMLF